MVIQNILSLFFGDDLKVFSSFDSNVVYGILGGNITGLQLVIMIVSFLMLISVMILINQTKLGLIFNGIADNQNLVEIFGISKYAYIIIASSISYFLMAVVGVMIAFVYGFSPNIGYQWMFYGIISLILGGVSKYTFVLIGALFLSAVQQFVIYYVGAKWMDMFSFFIFITFLILLSLNKRMSIKYTS